MELTLYNTTDSDDENDKRTAFLHRPVDLAHLSRYTMGNTVLEREVLELFRRQTRIYFERLCNAADEHRWHEAVRVLKTSARSVGAWQILATVENAEKLDDGEDHDIREELLNSLKDQIGKANAFIDGVFR